MTKHVRGCGGMADAADSKSADHKSCGFKSHQPHQVLNHRLMLVVFYVLIWKYGKSTAVAAIMQYFQPIKTSHLTVGR